MSSQKNRITQDLFHKTAFFFPNYRFLLLRNTWAYVRAHTGQSDIPNCVCWKLNKLLSTLPLFFFFHHLIPSYLNCDLLYAVTLTAPEGL